MRDSPVPVLLGSESGDEHRLAGSRGEGEDEVLRTDPTGIGGYAFIVAAVGSIKAMG